MTKTMRSRALLVLVAVIVALFYFLPQKSTIDVSIHGVDYSGHEFSYYIMDPEDSGRSAGGEHIDPFSAGGIACCAELPKKWKPGLKVKIHTTRWLPKEKPGDPLPEVQEVHVVDVPPYVDGKPGELWVLREKDGKISVVSSDFQPDHPDWPGKTKGWPVPSLEYRRERWEIYRNHEANGVKLYETFLSDLEKDPEKAAKEDWDFTKERDSKSLKEFKGPNDPRYIEKLREHYMEGLRNSRERLQAVMKAKP